MSKLLNMIAAVSLMASAAQASETYALLGGDGGAFAPFEGQGGISFEVSDAGVQRGHVAAYFVWGALPTGDASDLLSYSIGAENVLPGIGPHEGGMPTFLGMDVSFAPDGSVSGGSIEYAIDDVWGFRLAGTSNAFSGRVVDGMTNACWNDDCETTVHIQPASALALPASVPEPVTLALLLLPVLYVASSHRWRSAI